jgi:hypothetical protein
VIATIRMTPMTGETAASSPRKLGGVSIRRNRVGGDVT